MHSPSLDAKTSESDGDEVLVSVATLVTESRIPCGLNSRSKKFFEGPHCPLIKGSNKDHKCDLKNPLCLKYDNDRRTILNLCQKNLPLCIEVVLTCACRELDGKTANSDNIYVLEQWHFNVGFRRPTDPPHFNLNQLVSAIRSQLYFSQITAWLSIQDENCPLNLADDNFHYRISIPGKSLTTPKFLLTATKHDFPVSDVGDGRTLNVSFFSAPRTSNIPDLNCPNCLPKQQKAMRKNGMVDDRMHTSCTIKGKHRCDDFEEYDGVNIENKLSSIKKLCQNHKKCANGSCEASTSKPKLKVNIGKAQLYSMNYSNLHRGDSKNEKRIISPDEEQKLKSAKMDVAPANRHTANDLKKDKGQLLLDAIERSAQKSTNREIQNREPCANKSECNNAKCDKSESDILSIRERNRNNFNIYVDKHCDSPIPRLARKEIGDISNVGVHRRAGARQKIDFSDAGDGGCVPKCDGQTAKGDVISSTCEKKTKDLTVEVPSQSEQAKFRKNLDNAASMVFHSRTGLPLTSSPAPVRRGKSCFDFDSSINSVSAIKSALFSSSFSTDDESESEGSIVSPCSPETHVVSQKEASPVKYRRKGRAANLLGSFEESVLNGRLEPVSTVHGFTAELGASGTFVPKHLIVPVTVFFYTLGDNDKVSSPYLGHVNLGKKGYNVPKSGTVQLTLFNPLGTVVKMFVIMYDLSDMPPNSQTFIRQRTLYMPTKCKDANLEWGPKWLRYLIHLRFMSSKSGKIYLHSDIRMIIFRKCDMDTATAHGMDMSYELRSFTHMPTNPRFSPKK